jgi:hypothetical protein
MTKGYVFSAGVQKAFTKQADGSNLPAPKIGSWSATKTIDDVSKIGLIGFDPAVFEKQGYQIVPA